mmetsp:Transcript_25459/g.48125  ORF Transcript_25459/g.48125 Transcript_25459/m.48125 type:complete len:201 (-) Transcript_25459:471-1073(-)
MFGSRLTHLHPKAHRGCGHNHPKGPQGTQHPRASHHIHLYQMQLFPHRPCSFRCTRFFLNSLRSTVRSRNTAIYMQGYCTPLLVLNLACSCQAETPLIRVSTVKPFSNGDLSLTQNAMYSATSSTISGKGKPCKNFPSIRNPSLPVGAIFAYSPVSPGLPSPVLIAFVTPHPQAVSPKRIGDTDEAHICWPLVPTNTHNT